MVLSMAPSPAGIPGSGSFRLQFTPLGARIAILYGGLWALGLLVSLIPASWAPLLTPQVDGVATPLASLLALHPPGGGVPGGPGFRWWQVVTGPLLYPPGGLGGYVLGTLGLGFFGATVERFLGRRRFLELWGVATLGALLGAVLFGLIQHPPRAHYGFGAVVLALIVVNCSLTPNAYVNFFMVVPVKLQHIALGVAFIVVARTLGMFVPFGAQPGVGGYELGGLVVGWLFWRYRDQIDPRKAARRRKARRLLSAVEDTIQGGSDGSIYH
jgi:membrane associated rhomboid family serine protease